jgi:hypothetical protein
MATWLNREQDAGEDIRVVNLPTRPRGFDVSNIC